MPGATVRFKLQAVNNFTQNLLTLHGDISTTSPYIDTIIDAEGSFNNIIQGEKGWSSDYYEIQLADELPPNGIIEFTLTMYDEIISSETWISSFEIPVIELSQVLINDDNFRDSWGNNNNIAEGGETIEIYPLFDNNSYVKLYQAKMQLTTSENNINIWNNQTGATGIVYDTCDIMQQPIMPQSNTNSSEYDFVFTNAGSTGSPEFLPVLTAYAYSEPDTSWEIGGILMKYGMPFTLQNGEPGAGDLIPTTGDVNYTRTEFYQNVSACPENPSNIITPNKKVRFKLQIDNNTDHNLIALAGTISTDSTNVTITDSIGSFNNVAKDTTGWSSDEFEILIGDTFPVSGELSFTLTLNDPFYDSGTWTKNFTIPFLDFAQVVIDDDPNPDSNGDNDDIAEPGETIEVIPLLENLSQTTFYSAEGQLVTAAPYINIWNDTTGSSGTVYDTYIYNTGNQITPGSTNIMPDEDFVLDHNGDQTYSLDFSVITTTYAKAARDSSFETGGIRMVFGVPFAMNDGYPSAPVIITSPLEGDDIAKGNIVTVMVDANTISPVTVSKVDFYVNDVLIGTDTDFPYTYDWNTNGETSGENTIKAIMTDNQSDTFECEVTVNILDVYVVEASDDYSFFIPNEVFTGISPTDSTCTVLLTNGNFLPSWLSFDDSTLIFSGIAPAFNEVYFITIVADDGTQTITYNFVLKIMGTLMPSITLSVSGLDFGDVVVDSTSNAQTYTVGGTELTDSILITAPSGFEISLDGTTYTDTLILSPTDGTVSQTTIYVQFEPVAEQAYSGNILHENTDVTTVNVAVSGEGVSSLPIITVSETSLNFGGVVVDSTSNTQTYTVEGTELTDSILIVAPSGFEISPDGTTYTDTLTLDPVSGTVSQTTIYVQFKPVAEQAYSGNISHKNTDVTTVNIAVSGEGVNASSPLITISETSFDFGDVEVDSTSNTQIYTVEGANLTADILIIVPSGFEISLDSTTYTDTLTLSPAGGTVSQTTIYVQFAPTNQQAYSGNISHVSTDATTVSIALSGNAIVTAIGKIDSEMFIIYPNPVNNILTIEKSTGNEKCILEIYSITGKKLAVYNMETNKKEIDLSNFNSSVYFLKISTNRGYEVRKIIKF